MGNTWFEKAADNKRESGFWETFRNWPVNDDWAMTLYYYFMHGISPGSFFKAVLANDLMMAAERSHPANNWTEIMNISKWMRHNAPSISIGSFENVDAWLALSEEERDKILIRVGWKLTDEQLSWKIVSEKDHD